MKKIWIMVLGISIMVSLALSVFLASVFKVVESTQTAPNGIKDTYFSINVSKYQFNEPKEIELIRKDFFKIASGYQDILIIRHDEFNNTFSLYDPSGYFAGFNLVEGDYFKIDNFSPMESAVMVEENSSAHQLIENGYTLINGDYKSVRGVYGSDYPLSSKYYQYDNVFTLFSSKEWIGTYYFDNCQKATVNEIVNMLNRYGYEVSYNQNSFSVLSFLKVFFGNTVYIYMLLGIVFIFFAVYVTDFLLISRCSRVIIIHFRSGATKIRLFKKLMEYIIPIIVFGSFVGVAVARFILHYSIDVSLTAYIYSFLLHIIISILIMEIAFYKQKIWKNSGGNLL